MKKFLLSFFLLISSAAEAGTTILFPPNQAIILVQGRDSDAGDLFAAMAVGTINENGVEKKKINFKVSGRFASELVCQKSIHSEASSCTLKISGDMAHINKDQKYVLFTLNSASEARSAARKFYSFDDAYRGKVFTSSDEKLRIWKKFDYEGAVNSFVIEYEDMN